MIASSAEGPFAAELRRQIEQTGPVSIVNYMAAANAYYYAKADPLGVRGDFITAPEVSQMFGEMIGVWAVDLWQRAGSPEMLRYVELGPGRGTLARDALHTMARFGLRPRVSFIETSPLLREMQAQLVPCAQWHDRIEDIPDNGPVLFIANEFLDALGVRQYVKTHDGWRERMVGIIDDGFAPVAGSVSYDDAVSKVWRDAVVGTIVETSPFSDAVLAEMARVLVKSGGAALIIDYGYTKPQTGSSLQAVKAHYNVDPFADPGNADLTALIDFTAARAKAEAVGLRWLGTAEQGNWLKALGIITRAQALTRAAPDHAEAIDAALMRLTAPHHMGSLFKVMGLAAPLWPDGAGFLR